MHDERTVMVWMVVIHPLVNAEITADGISASLRIIRPIKSKPGWISSVPSRLLRDTPLLGIRQTCCHQLFMCRVQGHKGAGKRAREKQFL